MGLQEQIAEAIIAAFDELGGDPQNAISAARNHATVESWMQQETAMVAVAGGVEMAVPGLHALTIPAGISFLLHKMAYICRGIGTLSGGFVVETANYSDIRNIMTLWAMPPTTTCICSISRRFRWMCWSMPCPMRAMRHCPRPSSPRRRRTLIL